MLLVFSDISDLYGWRSATCIGARPANRKPSGWFASGKLSAPAKKRAKPTTATADCIKLGRRPDAFVGWIYAIFLRSLLLFIGTFFWAPVIVVSRHFGKYNPFGKNNPSNIGMSASENWRERDENISYNFFHVVLFYYYVLLLLLCLLL